MATAVAAPSKIGTRFGLPGVTRPFVRREANDGVVQTPKQSSTVNSTGLTAFKQTDIAKGWRLESTLAVTPAAGTTTLALSQYFPYNLYHTTKLQYQNQFSPVDLYDGIDAAIFQSYRPYNYGDMLSGRNLLDTSPASMPYSAQANGVSASNYTTASTSISFVYDLPAGLDFDRYYELDPKGNILAGPIRAFVSPQLMAGTSRVVTPVLQINAILVSGAGTSDSYLYYGSGTQTTPATATGLSLTQGFEGYGWYQPTDEQNKSDFPLPFSWQYVRKSQYVGIGGKSKIDLQFPVNGQILSTFVRLYDPAANVLTSVAYGAPIAVTAANITKCQVLYGPGLPIRDQTVLSMQEEFFRKHQFRATEGVLIWDFALNNKGEITNEEALNTLTTSGCIVHIEFASAVSSTAYAVIGAEALQYAPQF